MATRISTGGGVNGFAFGNLNLWNNKEFNIRGLTLGLGENRGFIKIIADSRWKEILGVHIIGPGATELIAEAVLAVKLECTAEELADTIHAHPTLSETIMEASFDLLGMPIHKM